MFNFTISANTAEEAIAEMKLLAAALGGGLPPMQEQPIREPAPPVNDNVTTTNTARPGDKPGSRTRKKDAATSAEASSTETTSPTEAKSADADTGAAATASPSEIPDIELVRAKLKQMGATDGLGHDKVFEVLGRYKATNASTVPEARRAELIAEIDELLKGAGK